MQVKTGKLEPSVAPGLDPVEFWNALAPYHASIENNYLDRRSVRRIIGALRQPVLVVGAGQGLIVEELRNRGFQCDGLDFSSEMIRYAGLRRGFSLIQADARCMPFKSGAYNTIIYATGVVDFMLEEEGIRSILDEGRRVVGSTGILFVAFYRVSPALESFMTRLGLLKAHVVSCRKSMESYLLNPVQMVTWVARQAGVGYFQAMALLLRLSATTSVQEKAITFRMQKIFRHLDNPSTLILAAPEKQPYRNEAEVGRLFERLQIPIKQMKASASCYMVQI